MRIQTSGQTEMANSSAKPQLQLSLAPSKTLRVGFTRLLTARYSFTELPRIAGFARQRSIEKNNSSIVGARSRPPGSRTATVALARWPNGSQLRGTNMLNHRPSPAWRNSSP
jgi:hypothetical protein